MSVTDSNRNGSGGLPTSVIDAAGRTVEHTSTQGLHSDEEPNPKFATRADVKPVEGIDKGKLILLGGGLAVAVLFFVFTAIVGKSPKKPVPVMHPSHAQPEATKPPKGSVTPLMETVRTPAPDNATGQLGPGDIRRTRSSDTGAAAKPLGAKPAVAGSLGGVPSFADTQQSGKTLRPTAPLPRQRHRNRSRTV